MAVTTSILYRPTRQGNAIAANAARGVPSGTVTEIFERLTAALADRYAVVRRVGGGGMADVFLARDRKHGREVALKILRPLAGAVIDRDRFIREIEIAARLHHPHILPLYDSGEADGLLY